ncbi:MAG: hypothetical protein IOD15_00085 [Phycisphaerales bacterium]|nr:hypothetical protein [Phycisphaerales bacterium]
MKIFGPATRAGKLPPWRFVRLKCDGCGCQTPRTVAHVGSEDARLMAVGCQAGWAMSLAAEGRAIELCSACRPDAIDIWKDKMRRLAAGGAGGGA